MRICGVELVGSEAVICLLTLEKGTFNLPDCRVRKLTLKKGHTREDLQRFQFDFAKLMADYSVNKVVIQERLLKGKTAGGAITFKLEAAIQLMDDIDVEILSELQIKDTLSGYPLPVPFTDTELKVFQKTAFHVAYAAHRLR